MFQDSDSLRERMITIENQLKKLQQCLSSTNSAPQAGTGTVVAASMGGISSSTGNSAENEFEVICIREAETSEDATTAIKSNDNDEDDIDEEELEDEDHHHKAAEHDSTDENI